MEANSSLGVSYEERIRPWLNTVDTLRDFGIVKEGIRLPTIVVVGDQSSGKSSVLESLAGIRLPTGQGICTRVPLILRLHSSKSEDCKITVEYDGNAITITEANISKTVEEITLQIAGEEKGVSDTPITLNVHKKNAPDLTMVDLPGITRVPVHGQPADIYEQISAIIKQYISPKESIILNVLSATVNFATCESIRMSQGVDQNGERTLGVVTKVDKAPEGLYEKVTDDAVNVGLGYICVRNRLGEESIEEAREKERILLKEDVHLSKIEKSMAGIPVLADKLMQMQSMEIVKCLPDIVKKIDILLSEREAELASLPRQITDSSQAVLMLVKILDEIKSLLISIFKQGDSVGFENDVEMHGAVNMNKLFTRFSEKFSEASCCISAAEFLTEELKLLKDADDFLSPAVSQILVNRRIDIVSQMCKDLVVKTCESVDTVVSKAIDMKTSCYSQLNASARMAFSKVMEEKRETALSRVAELLDVERNVVFTKNPSFAERTAAHDVERKKFVEGMDHSVNHISNLVCFWGTTNAPPTYQGTMPAPGRCDNYNTLSWGVEGVVALEHTDLRRMGVIPRSVLLSAFDMWMKVNAYWNVVMLRLVDQVCLHLCYGTLMLTEKEFVSAVFNELAGSNIKNMQMCDMFYETPAVASKRKALQNSVQRLRQAKAVVGKLLGGAHS